MPNGDEIRKVLAGPSTSNWMKVALTTALNRDPVDAANDADFLAILLKQGLNEIVDREVFDIQMQLAIQKAKTQRRS